MHRGLVRDDGGEPATALVHLYATKRSAVDDSALVLAGCAGLEHGLRSPVTTERRVLALGRLPSLLEAALPGGSDADDTRDCSGGLHLHVIRNCREATLIEDQAFVDAAEVRSVVTMVFDLPPDDRAVLLLYARVDVSPSPSRQLRLLALEIWRALLRVCGHWRSGGASLDPSSGGSLAVTCRLRSQVAALRDLLRLHYEHVDESAAAVAHQRALADAGDRRISAVLQALPDPIFSFRSDGSSFALGHAPGAAPATGGLPDELKVLARAAISTGQSQRLIVDDGAARREFRVVRVDQDEAICLARDISEIARAECEAAEARSKAEFMATMSHEIRTPLNGVIGLLELLKHTPLVGEQVEFVSTAERAAHHLLDLVSNLLDLSRVESGAAELEAAPVAVRGLLEETLLLNDVRARGKGLALECSVGEGVPPHVLGDALRLRQVLLNLVSNAIKFSSAGTIRVAVSVAAPQVLRFAVSDQGVGVPAHARQRVFEAFRQADDATSRKYGGSGLGLALCTRYVAMMGGSMELESDDGRGSTFSFTAVLPPVEEGAVVPEVVRPESVAPLPLSVLVAEDDATNRLVITRVLQNLGHAVHVVEDGRAAVEAARLGVHDLILMDLEMPVLDGLGATRQIIAHGGLEAPRVVALTAHVTPEHRARCREAGVADFLAKPIDVRKLEPLLASVGRSKARARLVHPDASAGEGREPLLDRDESVKRLGGDESLWAELVEAMRSEMPTLLADLGGALDARRLDAACRTAHSMRGALLNIGARSSAAEAARVERFAAGRRWDLARTSATRLELELSRLAAELRRASAAS
ncbi:MAG: response regulator [Myxococcales bacterium]|nr:response regulator [Myxococcales bacterium]